MIMKRLASVLLLVFPLVASAQYQGSPPSYAEAGGFISGDSDGFRETNVWTGTKLKASSSDNVVFGIGPRVGYSWYSGDDLGVTANGAFLQGAFVYQTSRIDLQGSLGIKNLYHSTDYDTLSHTYANREINRTERWREKERAREKLRSEGKDSPPLSNVEIADIRDCYKENKAKDYIKRDVKGKKEIVNDENPPYVCDQRMPGSVNSSKLSGSKNYLVGDIEFRATINPIVTLGFVGGSDNVASERAIINGIFFHTLAFTADLTFTDNLSLSVIRGATYFSDDNIRAYARNKLTWVFLPEYGLSTYVRFNAQIDSNPGSPNYYSPEVLQRITLGFKVKKRHEGLIYSASGEYGREWATNTARHFDYNENVRSNVYYWNVGVQTPSTKEHKATFSFNIYGTNVNQSHADSSGKYRWTAASAWVNIPF